MMTNQLIREQLIACIDSFCKNPSSYNRQNLITLLNDVNNKDIVQEILIDLFVKQKEITEKYNVLQNDFRVTQQRCESLQKIVQQEKKFSYYRGIIVDYYLDDEQSVRVVIAAGGMKEDMVIGSQVKVQEIGIGKEAVIVNINGTKSVIGIKEPMQFDGAVCKIVKVLDSKRLLVSRFNGGEELPGLLKDGLMVSDVKVGGQVRMDLQSRIIYEIFETKIEATRFALTGNAKHTFDNIGGLFEVKQELNKKLILPLKNPNIFEQYDIKPIRGVLLYGPPGNGKTMVAGAIFNELNNSLKDNLTDEKLASLQATHFFFVSGPEVLSKWVGEGEETIRNIFRAAKEASLDGYPAVIFWDEIDSIARTRQETHAYATEKTIVPTLLSELNGLNTNGNVVLIAATNRPDLLDPALLRAGRLGDLKLEIKRPNKQETIDIINKYLKQEYKKDNCTHEQCVEAIINTFFNDNVMGKILLSDKTEYVITAADFVSGASINKIVQDALMETALNEISNKNNGISKETLQLFAEKEIKDQIKLFKSHNIRDFIVLPEHVNPISVNISI